MFAKEPPQAWKEVGERLKKQTEAEKGPDMVKTVEKELDEKKAKQLAPVQYNGLSVPTAVADIYRAAASIGAENIFQESIPTLKVVEAMTQLPDNVDARPGSFYYSTTQEVFASPVTVSILTVSRGFYALDVNGRPAFNQIITGMILDGMKPFIMYFSGGRLNNLWNEFGKTISPHTKNKQNPIPMFAFKVQLSTEKIKYDKGSAHVIHFGFPKVNDFPELITELDVVKMLREGIERMELTVAGMIEQKEVDRNTGQPLKDQPVTQRVEEVTEAVMSDESLIPDEYLNSEPTPFD